MKTASDRLIFRVHTGQLSQAARNRVVQAWRNALKNQSNKK